MAQNIQDLLAQREALDKKIADARKEERAAAIATVRSLVAEFKLTAADAGFDKRRRGSGPGTGTVKPKFCGPGGETWAGRGRKPKWLEKALAAGRSLEEFRI
jgi:DNA-binding protein H-NS